MKHAKHAYFIFSLLLLAFVSSCQKEPCYSCDDGVDSWAHENIEKISLMSKTEVVELHLEKQRAAFRIFEPNKRKKLWSDKMVEVRNFLNSEEELQHFSIMENFIERHTFDEDITHEQEKFLFDWFDEGKEKFGWTDYFRISAFMRLGKVVNNEKEFKELYVKDLLSYNNEPKSGNDVTLSQIMALNVANAETSCDSRWCLDCNLIGGTCLTGCSNTSTGCGWAWSQSCNKNCAP